VEGALGGIHAGLEAEEFAAGLAEDVAQGVGGIELFGGVDFVLGELGFHAAEAAHQPDGDDGGVDGVTLFGGDGLVKSVVFGAESFQFGGIFAGKDQGFGVDAGFQGIPGGAGLTLVGAGARGVLRVEAVGLGLFVGSHGVDLKKPLGR